MKDKVFYEIGEIVFDKTLRERCAVLSQDGQEGLRVRALSSDDGSFRWVSLENIERLTDNVKVNV